MKPTLKTADIPEKHPDAKPKPVYYLVDNNYIQC